MPPACTPTTASYHEQSASVKVSRRGLRGQILLKILVVEVEVDAKVEEGANSLVLQKSLISADCVCPSIHGALDLGAS